MPLRNSASYLIPLILPGKYFSLVTVLTIVCILYVYCVLCNIYLYMDIFFCLTKFNFKFLKRCFSTENLDKKISFAPILFKLRSAYVSEDSKKMKRKIAKKIVDNIFSIYFMKFFFLLSVPIDFGQNLSFFFFAGK